MDAHFDSTEAATLLPGNDEGHRANGAPRETQDNQHRDSGAAQAVRQQAVRGFSVPSAEAESTTRTCVGKLRQVLNLSAAAAAVQLDAGDDASDQQASDKGHVTPDERMRQTQAEKERLTLPNNALLAGRIGLQSQSAFVSSRVRPALWPAGSELQRDECTPIGPSTCGVA
jgi:hypothetical protein